MNYNLYEPYDLLVVVPSIIQQTPTGQYYLTQYYCFGELILLLSGDWAVPPQTFKPWFFSVYHAKWLGYSGYQEPNTYYSKAIYPLSTSTMYKSEFAQYILYTENDGASTLVYNCIKIDIYGANLF